MKKTPQERAYLEWLRLYSAWVKRGRTDPPLPSKPEGFDLWLQGENPLKLRLNPEARNDIRQMRLTAVLMQQMAQDPYVDLERAAERMASNLQRSWMETAYEEYCRMSEERMSDPTMWTLPPQIVGADHTVHPPREARSVRRENRAQYTPRHGEWRWINSQDQPVWIDAPVGTTVNEHANEEWPVQYRTVYQERRPIYPPIINEPTPF